MNEITYEQDSPNHLRVIGKVDYQSVVALTQRGYELIESAQFEHYTVDFSGVSVFNSTLLSMMLCWVRKSAQVQVTLGFSSVPALATTMAHAYGVQFIFGSE